MNKKEASKISVGEVVSVKGNPEIGNCKVKSIKCENEEYTFGIVGMFFSGETKYYNHKDLAKVEGVNPEEVQVYDNELEVNRESSNMAPEKDSTESEAKKDASAVKRGRQQRENQIVETTCGEVFTEEDHEKAPFKSKSNLDQSEKAAIFQMEENRMYSVKVAGSNKCYLIESSSLNNAKKIYNKSKK